MFAKKIKTVRMERKKQFEKGDPQTLPLIAEEIRLRMQVMKENIYEIGKLLKMAKKTYKHGEFQDWIRDNNLGFSYQTANNFMHVYECCLNRPKLVQSFPPSVLYLITSPNCPEDLRELLFENSTCLEKIKNKDIKKIIRSYRDGEIDRNSPEIKSLLKYDRGKRRYKRNHQAIELNLELLNNLLKDVLGMEKKIKWPARKKDKKTELTRDQHKVINTIFDDLKQGLKKIRPKSKIMDDPKPKLKLVKTTKK